MALTAGYAGVCSVCGLRFPPGALITFRRGAYRHSECDPPRPALHRVELVVVYADGSTLGNPGCGGWGWWFASDCFESGFVAKATNQRMEILAATEAITSLGPEHRGLTVTTDSEYVIDGATKWFHNWLASGWKAKDGKPVKNQDLWEPLIEAVQEFDARFSWVKGHDGCPGNEMADTLANQAAHGYPLSMRPANQSLAVGS